MKSPKLVAIVCLFIGLFVGVAYRPYQIITSADKSFKINRVTGAVWVYHWELGQWIEVTTR